MVLSQSLVAAVCAFSQHLLAVLNQVKSLISSKHSHAITAALLSFLPPLSVLRRRQGAGLGRLGPPGPSGGPGGRSALAGADRQRRAALALPVAAVPESGEQLQNS